MAFSFRHTHILAAFRTGKMPVLAPVIEPLFPDPYELPDAARHGQEFLILRVSFRYIPREHAEIGINKYPPDEDLEDPASDKNGQYNKNEHSSDQKASEAVHPVSPVHKMTQIIVHSAHKISHDQSPAML